MTTKRIATRITAAAERQLRAGHPWLFEGAIQDLSHEGASGDLAVIFDRKRRFLAIGLYDPHSPIRVRILHQGSPATIDEAWFHQRMSAAAALRVHLPETQTNGYRVIHGENDGLPGLVVDRYAETLVVKLYTSAWLPYLTTILSGLAQIQPEARVVLRLSRAVEPFAAAQGLHEGQILAGDLLDGPVIFEENGLRFESDPVRGQKTGFFLDQRDNRARVGDLSEGKRVLNVFAYTGGFSLYAARGGAVEVTSLDISQPALDGAKRNFELNSGALSSLLGPHNILKGDAFQAMADLHDQKQTFDLIVIDPPAFAKRQSEIEGALSAYGRLTQLGLNILAPKGTIVLASCSSRVDSASFGETVNVAARHADRPLNEFLQTGHAVDHPIGFKEGAYLKCVYAMA